MGTLERLQCLLQDQAAILTQAHIPTLAEVRDQNEKDHLSKALESAGGQVDVAAQILGLPIRTMYWKLNKYRIGFKDRRKVARE